MTTRFTNRIKLKEYDRRIHQGIVGVAERLGLTMQNAARQNAPWTDRTGNARSGLFSQVTDSYGNWIRIYLAGTVEYQVFLETSAGGRWQVIMPTIEQHLPELKRQLEAVLK